MLCKFLVGALHQLALLWMRLCFISYFLILILFCHRLYFFMFHIRNISLRLYRYILFSAIQSTFVDHRNLLFSDYLQKYRIVLHKH